MNLNTIELLSTFSLDIKIIDISNKNIIGILNLKQFTNLEKLDCSHNNITQLINLSNKLKYLNCSYNKIIKITKLPDLIGFNCSHNPICQLYIPFNVIITKYPKNLSHITYGKNFNKSLQNLPISLKEIYFGSSFNKPIGDILSNYHNIHTIHFGENFNQSIDFLPPKLKTIKFGFYFNQSIDKLPNSIETISFFDNKRTIGRGKYFNPMFSKSLDKLPFNLKKIIINIGFTSRIDNLPPNLQTLIFSTCLYANLGKNESVYNERHNLLINTFNNPVDLLPTSLINIEFGHGFNYPVDLLPKNIKRLSFNSIEVHHDINPFLHRTYYKYSSFNQSINNLPFGLIYLALNKNFNHSLDHLPNSINFLISSNTLHNNIINNNSKLINI